MIRLTTLGATDLRGHNGHPLRDVMAQPKRVALLVYLAVASRRHPVHRDTLLALFWPESDLERARNTLSQALHHLRSTLGADAIANVGSTALSANPAVLWCDAGAFAEALERNDLATALALYHGDFCRGLYVAGAPAAEEWFEEQRARLRHLALEAAHEQAASLERSGDGAGAARSARRALELRPDNEQVVRELLALQDRCGDSTGALLAYDLWARRLREELELEPEPATRQLAEQLRRRRDAAAVPDVPMPGAPTPAVSAASDAEPRAPDRRWPVAAAAAVVVLMAAGFLAVPRIGAPRPAAAPGSVAVFPFTVRAAGSLQYLSEGLVDLLSAKLDGSSGLRAVDPRAAIARLRQPPTDPVAADRASRSLGAHRYILGEVLLTDGRVRLSARLYQSGSARPVASASITGDSTAVFELVDGLAARLLAEITPSRDSMLTRLAAVTTHSLPALKAFLEGERLLREGHEARAFEAFRDALSLDTAFALAYYRGSLVAGWANAGNLSEGPRWAGAAARHSAKLTPLVRDLLAGLRAYREVRPDAAERQYRTVLELRPDNVEAWLMLGEILFHYRPNSGRAPAPARAAFERVLALDPADPHALVHLARQAAMEGRRGDLDSLSRAYLARHPDGDRAFEMRALGSLLDGQGMAVAAEARGATDFLVNSLLEAAACFANDLPAARMLSAIATDPARASWLRVAAARIGADVALASGSLEREPAMRYDAAWLDESRALIAAEPFFPAGEHQVRRLRARLRSAGSWPAMYIPGYPNTDSAMGPAMREYLVGRLSLRLGDTAQARASLAALSARRDDGRHLGIALRGAIHRHEGRPAAALADFEQLLAARNGRGAMLQISNQHIGSGERFAAAEILLAMRRDSAALELYQSFVRPWDVPFIPAAHLRRGEIFERRGELAQARFHYERAARLWTEADSTLALLPARARQALERIPAPAR